MGMGMEERGGVGGREEEHWLVSTQVVSIFVT